MEVRGRKCGGIHLATMPFKVPKKEIARAGVMCIARTQYHTPRTPLTPAQAALFPCEGFPALP